MYIYNTTVEFDDLDSYGIIHHPRVLHYFERARVHFLSDNGINLKNFDIGVVIRNVNLKYKIQLTLLEQVAIEVVIKNLEKYRFEWEFKVKKTDPGSQQGKTAVYGLLETATIDLKTKKLTPIPDDIREILQTIVH